MDTKILHTTLERARNENGGLPQLGASFYTRLFQKYPGVQPLFTSDNEEQQKKLMAALGAIIASADNSNALMPYLQAMGIRHNQYKAESAHYPAVAENLVAVLQEHLSKEGTWTDEMSANWQMALDMVAQVMIDAASNPDKYATELSSAGYQPDGNKK